ncbi:hypothetical protein Q9L58_004844 [Maublancomyces gigas]|uniref:Uncharacterized protein n=1 Tax=Discina gigas TaxID=1032678 RepID=A0ABR3GJS4_9PEZI
MSPLSNINKETGLDGRSLLPQSQTARKPKSKTARVKSTLKTMIHPVRSRREKKARKKELRAREEAERIANINDFLECGRVYYETQLEEKIVCDPFANPRLQKI